MAVNSDRFTCVAVGHEIIEPKDETRSPQVSVKLRVVEGHETGREIWWYGSLHENAQQYTAQALRDMGWSCNDITALTGLGSVKVNAVAKQSEYQGKVRTQWMIFPAARASIRPEAKATLAKQFKALAASIKPIEVTELNKAPEQVPTSTSSNGTDATFQY